MKLEGPELELGMELERKPELEERELFEGAGGELEGLRGGMCRRGSMLSRMTYGRPVSGEGARGKEQEGLGVKKGMKL